MRFGRNSWCVVVALSALGVVGCGVDVSPPCEGEECNAAADVGVDEENVGTDSSALFYGHGYGLRPDLAGYRFWGPGGRSVWMIDGYGYRRYFPDLYTYGNFYGGYPYGTAYGACGAYGGYGAYAGIYGYNAGLYNIPAGVPFASGAYLATECTTVAVGCGNGYIANGNYAYPVATPYAASPYNFNWYGARHVSASWVGGYTAGPAWY